MSWSYSIETGGRWGGGRGEGEEGEEGGGGEGGKGYQNAINFANLVPPCSIPAQVPHPPSLPSSPPHGCTCGHENYIASLLNSSVQDATLMSCHKHAAALCMYSMRDLLMFSVDTFPDSGNTSNATLSSTCRSVPPTTARSTYIGTTLCIKFDHKNILTRVSTWGMLHPLEIELCMVGIQMGIQDH